MIRAFWFGDVMSTLHIAPQEAAVGWFINSGTCKAEPLSCPERWDGRNGRPEIKEKKNIWMIKLQDITNV